MAGAGPTAKTSAPPGSSGWPKVSAISLESVTRYVVRPRGTPRMARVSPQASTLSPGSSGSTRTSSLRSVFASTGFVSSTRHGSKGVQRPPHPHSWLRTRKGP